MSTSITTTINDIVELFTLTKVADNDVITRLRDVQMKAIDKQTNNTG